MSVPPNPKRHILINNVFIDYYLQKTNEKLFQNSSTTMEIGSLFSQPMTGEGRSLIDDALLAMHANLLNPDFKMAAMYVNLRKHEFNMAEYNSKWPTFLARKFFK